MLCNIFVDTCGSSYQHICTINYSGCHVFFIMNLAINNYYCRVQSSLLSCSIAFELFSISLRSVQLSVGASLMFLCNDTI